MNVEYSKLRMSDCSVAISYESYTTLHNIATTPKVISLSLYLIFSLCVY